MHLDEQQQCFIAVKILLRRGDELLLINDKFNDGWDLPGGRVRQDEFGQPLAVAITRKMRVELGTEVVYKLGEIKTTFQHTRTEEGAIGNPKINIFAVGFEANYISGDIALPEYIKKYEWFKVNELDPKKYLNDGWCRGVDEYLKNI